MNVYSGEKPQVPLANPPLDEFSHDSHDSNVTRTRASSRGALKTHALIIDKQSMDYVIRSGVAGGIAGCAAKTLIAPLDRVKILFQTSNPEFKHYTKSWMGFYRAGTQIYQNQGIVGLFQGHSATLVRIFPYAAIKFVAYEQIRSIIIPSKDKETSPRRFISGSLAGITSVFFTYPLDLIRVRLAFETKSNFGLEPSMHKHRHHYHYTGGRFIQTCRLILQEGNHLKAEVGVSPASLSHTISTTPVRSFSLRGLTNFYRGFTPTILGMIPYAGVSFWAHDLFHDIFRSPFLATYAVSEQLPDLIFEEEEAERNRKALNRPRVPLNAWAQLTAGGLAGICSQTASYPLEVVRRRMQVAGAIGDGSRVRMVQTIKLIFAESGIRGFFVGLSIGFIKVTPMVACSFFVYERAKLMLGI